jgi:hypothetical protein
MSKTHPLPNNHNTDAWAGSYAGNVPIPTTLFEADVLYFSDILDTCATN